MSEARRTDFTELLELLNVCDDIGEKVIYQGQVILTSHWSLPITILASHWSMITILTFHWSFARATARTVTGALRASAGESPSPRWTGQTGESRERAVQWS